MSGFKSCKFQGLNRFLWILANFQSFWKIFPVSPVFTVAAYFHEKLGKISKDSALTVFCKVLELWTSFLTVPTIPELDVYILSYNFSKITAQTGQFFLKNLFWVIFWNKVDWKTDLSQCYTLLGTEADLEPEIDLDTNPTFIGEFPMPVKCSIAWPVWLYWSTVYFGLYGPSLGRSILYYFLSKSSHWLN